MYKTAAGCRRESRPRRDDREFKKNVARTREISDRTELCSFLKHQGSQDPSATTTEESAHHQSVHLRVSAVYLFRRILITTTSFADRRAETEQNNDR